MHNNPRPIKVLLLDSLGRKRTVEFATEDEAIEFLKATYCTEAPLAFSYLDGPPVEAKVIDRINRRVFEGQVSGSESNAADAVP